MLFNANMEASLQRESPIWRTQLSVPRYLFAVVGHDPTSGGLRSFPLSSHYLSISASHSPSPSPVLSPFSLPSASHSPFPTFTIFIFCSLSPSPAAYSPSPATCSPSSALSRWYSSFLSPIFTLHLLLTVLLYFYPPYS